MLLRGLLGAGAAVASTALLVGAILGAIGTGGRSPGDDSAGSPPAAWLSGVFSLPGPHSNDAAVVGEYGPASPDHTSGGTGAEPAGFEHIYRIARGDTLSGVLERVGISAAEAQEVVSALRPVYDPRKLRTGQEVVFNLAPAAGSLVPHLGQLSFAAEFPYQVVVARDAEGRFSASRTEREVNAVISDAAGLIRSSLFADGVAAGVPEGVLAATLRIFAWDVDFQRDIRKGDRFAVVYEEFTDSRGESVRGGGVVAATLILRGKTKTLYRFQRPGETDEYFTADGHSARKALLRTPIDGARLSSGYGMRRHPILGYSKMHKGVDFAAPRGTPIYAAGDGIVEFVGRRGGYGKYVRIRHRSGYSTAYAHASRYGSGIRKGSRVSQGQVIAYVGSTGRSTGPHLHYEILKDGRHINPMTVKMMPGPRLTGAELARFRAEIAPVHARLIARLEDVGAPVVARIETD